MSSSFESDVIKAHNEYRANHNAAPLKQKDELTNVAQKWAKHLASSGKFGHSNHEDYGENIAMTSAKNPTGGEITAMWYDEIHKYDFKKPGFKSGIGHFTQVVWRDSKHIGVGMASGKYGSFVVANYEPRGNWSMTGQFENNVLPPTKAVVKRDVGGADGGEGEGKVDTKVTTKVEETTDENGQKIRKTTKTTVTTTTKNGGTSTSTKTEVETKKI